MSTRGIVSRLRIFFVFHKSRGSRDFTSPRVFESLETGVVAGQAVGVADIVFLFHAVE